MSRRYFEPGDFRVIETKQEAERLLKDGAAVRFGFMLTYMAIEHVEGGPFVSGPVGGWVSRAESAAAWAEADPPFVVVRGAQKDPPDVGEPAAWHEVWAHCTADLTARYRATNAKGDVCNGVRGNGKRALLYDDAVGPRMFCGAFHHPSRHNWSFVREADYQPTGAVAVDL